jgi:hypothetical protein
LTVTWPPESMVVWSMVTGAVTVTVWGLRIVMTPLALVGVATAGTQLTPSNLSQVDVAFQLPLAADR